MTVENFVEIIVILVKVTFAVGIIAGVLKIASNLMKDKNQE
jgi:hypothetical protein